MSTLRFAKVVATLPVPLERDTLYLVRTGAGFDLFCSDATGAVAHALNGGGGQAGWPVQVGVEPTLWPRRVGHPKIAGDVASSALATLALTAARQHFVPLLVPRAVQLSGLRLSVTTALAGTAALGVYANTTNAGGDDVPGALLTTSATVDVGTTGDRTASLAQALTLQPGLLYWASLICSSAATLRALPVAAISSALGRQVNGTAAITHLFAAGSGSTLPASAPASIAAGAGNIPAIYLIEA